MFYININSFVLIRYFHGMTDASFKKCFFFLKQMTYDLIGCRFINQLIEETGTLGELAFYISPRTCPAKSN